MRYLILALLLTFSTEVMACDICGGVNSNASIGLFASTKFHTIGFNSSFRGFSSYMYGIRHSQEYLFGQEIQFRTQIHSRIQLMGFIPYQYAVQKRDLENDYVWGLSDPTLIGNFILFQDKDSTGITKNFLTVGTGVKMPLGKTVSNSNSLKNLYPGTGSWDFLIMSNYTKQLSKTWGWQTEGSYAMKGKDSFGFQYGNATLLSSQVFASRKISSFRLIAAVGLQFENHQNSRLNGQVNSSNTNAGYIVSTKGSINLMTYRWLWSLYLQQPISQNINTGMIHQNFSGGISLNYLIKKSKK